MPEPPVRLEQWLRANEDDAEDDDDPDDSKPLQLRLTPPGQTTPEIEVYFLFFLLVLF
jgi:hypothetical protein